VSAVHIALQTPSAQIGVVPEHCAALEQLVPPVGSQTPFTQDEPAAHCTSPPEHWETHSPSAQTSPVPHWLEYWQAFDPAVHDPATQT
jgi:hypothetical protein